MASQQQLRGVAIIDKDLSTHIHRWLGARSYEQYAQKMLIAYVDESFSEGHYFMGALVLAPKDVGQLARNLHDLMEEVARENLGQINRNEEFHGSDLWGGKGVWRGIEKGERYRFAVVDRAVEIIINIDLTIFLQGIDIKLLTQRYSLPESPHKLALTFLIEKVDRHFEKAATYGLVICDHVGSPSEDSRYRKDFLDLQLNGTGGNFPRKICRIVDTLHFVKSKESRLVQAIDLIVFIHRRRTVHRTLQQSERVFLDYLWDKIQARVSYNRTWSP